MDDRYLSTDPFTADQKIVQILCVILCSRIDIKTSVHNTFKAFIESNRFVDPLRGEILAVLDGEKEYLSPAARKAVAAMYQGKFMERQCKKIFPETEFQELIQSLRSNTTKLDTSANSLEAHLESRHPTIYENLKYIRKEDRKIEDYLVDAKDYLERLQENTAESLQENQAARQSVHGLSLSDVEAALGSQLAPGSEAYNNIMAQLAKKLEEKQLPPGSAPQ